MTTLQQAQELLAELPEKDVNEVFNLMKDMIAARKRRAREGKKLAKEWMAMREMALNYEFEDIDTAREAVLTAKYGKF